MKKERKKETAVGVGVDIGAGLLTYYHPEQM